MRCVCVHVAWLVDTGGRAIDVEHTLSPHSLISGHFTLLCVFIYLPIITLTLTLTAFEWITLIWPLYSFHIVFFSSGSSFSYLLLTLVAFEFIMIM